MVVVVVLLVVVLVVLLAVVLALLAVPVMVKVTASELLASALVALVSSIRATGTVKESPEVPPGWRAEAWRATLTLAREAREPMSDPFHMTSTTLSRPGFVPVPNVTARVSGVDPWLVIVTEDVGPVSPGTALANVTVPIGQHGAYTRRAGLEGTAGSGGEGGLYRRPAE